MFNVVQSEVELPVECQCEYKNDQTSQISLFPLNCFRVNNVTMPLQMDGFAGVN